MVVTFGEVMMRLSTPEHIRFGQAENLKIHYGGSEANVSTSLCYMGLNCAHVTVFPENAFGKAARNSLRKEGVHTDFTPFSTGRLGTYFLENGSMQRPSKIVYDRADSAFANLKPEDFNWQEILKEASWFHWTGITPAISENAAKACLDAIHTAAELGIYISGDINYRRNLWQYGKTPQSIMPSLIEKTNLIIGGEVDFENCLGITSTSFEDAAQQAQKMFPAIKLVSSTLRDNISASHNKLKGRVWNGVETLFSKEYDVTHIVDRVGGGDAFMAGLIYGLKELDSEQEALEYAVAASVLKHSIHGDVSLSSADEVRQLMSGENVGKLLR